MTNKEHTELIDELIEFSAEAWATDNPNIFLARDACVQQLEKEHERLSDRVKELEELVDDNMCDRRYFGFLV